MNTNTRLLQEVKNYKNNMDITFLINLENMLIANIREEEAKKSGVKKPLQVVKNVLKEAESRMHGYVFQNENKYYFTDGHRILETENNFGYEKANFYFENASKCFDDLAQNDLEIIVNMENVRVFTKEHKKSERVPYVIRLTEKAILAVNPYYFIDAYSITENNHFYINSDYVKSGCYKSMIFNSGNGAKWALLPIHHEKAICNQDISGNIIE